MNKIVCQNCWLAYTQASDAPSCSWEWNDPTIWKRETDNVEIMIAEVRKVLGMEVADRISDRRIRTDDGLWKHGGVFCHQSVDGVVKHTKGPAESCRYKTEHMVLDQGGE